MGECMTTINIEASNTVTVYGSDAAYTTARNTASGNSVGLSAGQLLSAGVYQTDRSFLKFQTDTIPSEAQITRCYLRLTCNVDYSTTDFDLQIIEQDWSASDPIGSGNRETVYDDCLAASSAFLWRNTNGMSVDVAYDGADMTPSYINRLGVTYYSLRSKRDKDALEPANSERVLLYNHTYGYPGDAKRPRLVVEYVTPRPAFFLVRNNRRPM